jgi:DNA-binding FrmR family transcriptional regulator
MASYVHHKDAIQARLRRIEGQVRGLQKMIDEEKYCVDVLTQVSSVTAALQKVGVIILEDHINGCVRNALADEKQAERAVAELIAVVERFVKAGPTAPVSAD